MSTYARRKGSQWENEILRELRAHGYTAERLHLTGREDEGDIVFQPHTLPTIIEAKAEKQIDLPAYLREVELERHNYAKHRGLERVPDGVVVVKARGKSTLDAYVVQSFRQWLGE